jgi:Fic family protein
MIELPLRITGRAAMRLGEIERLLGSWEGGLKDPAPPLKLQFTNRIKTVFSTVALAGSGLSLEVATDVLRGKRGLLAVRDVLQLENAALAYEQLPAWAPLHKGQLLEAHGILLRLLTPEAGRFHGKWGQEALQSLLRFLRQERDVPPIVAAILFHHQLAAIRPFADGNGRLGRLWLRALLRRAAPLLQHAPVEAVMLEHRKRYQAALASAEQPGSFDAFLELLLDLLLLALQQLGAQLRSQTETAKDRLAKAKALLGKRWFSRKDYLSHFPKLSTASASRDLATAVTAKALSTQGERRSTEYRFR